MNLCTDGYDRCLKKTAPGHGIGLQSSDRLQCASAYAACAKACVE